MTATEPHQSVRKREHLSFATEAGVIADVKRLRRGCTAGGNWSLEQACWHLAATLPYPPVAGDQTTPLTPEQQDFRPFVETVFRTGSPPPGFQAPAQVVPPATCDGSAIDDYLCRLEAFAAFTAPVIAHPAFGPLPTLKYRQFTLGHAARHLAFLRPIHGPRDGLRFADEDAAIADIQMLRAGHEQVGGWSLPQICWHVDTAMQFRMREGPFDPNTPEQDARKPILERVLATGELPKGIESPAVVVPPTEVGDDAIDGCIATLRKFKTFANEFAPHRLFGHMSAELTHKQNLIHVAHHLSHLVPTSTK